MSKVIIIAEAGVNHNGSMKNALKLIDIAKNAGANYIKFQTFLTDLNVSKNSPLADYQKNHTAKNQYDLVKKLELSFEDFTDIQNYCKQKEIGFLSTGFDAPSINYLDSLEVDFFKIPSGEITNKPYLEMIALKKRPIILSTGMANIQEVNVALSILLSSGLTKNDITVLHCNTEYPTPMEDVNLKAMLHIQREFGVKVGYSDHTLGIEVPIAAVALGAEVIEKHFTLDRTLPGPDHNASLEPDELKQMIKSIRNIEKAISGNGLKEPSKSEQKNIVIARKSIHLKNDLNKDHVLGIEDIIMRRPGNGISPMDIDKVIGKKTNTNLLKDTMLNWKNLK
jgi:N-acetylneuraminate synthase/N,N'-diacetyllegionaminate synthase